MQGNKLFGFKELSTILTVGGDKDIVDLLSNTVLGSKGAMRYKLTDFAQRIAAYKNIRFVSLVKGKNLMATVGLCYRQIHQGKTTMHGTYLRYLSVMARYQSPEDTSKRNKKTNGELSQDSMKGKILSFIKKPDMLDFPGFDENDKNVVYAYVESKNERSRNLIQQAGFQYIRSFLTVAFSRFNPKADKRVVKAEEAEKPLILERLKEYYKEYSIYSDETVFYEDSYYILKSEGEIVAGLSAVPTVYDVVDIPGVWGWVLMHLLPYLPWYRRLFQPGEFRFLVFGYPWVKPGHEKDLEKLMESVCAKEGIHTALTWVDDRSDLYDTYRTDINMGALNRMLNVNPGLVYVNFLNLNDKEKEFFYDNPAFISGFDFT